MKFAITHETHYTYRQPAAEAYLELRLQPPQRESQTLLEHEVITRPSSTLSGYEDAFGNITSFFSIPHRHEDLTIISKSKVETRLQPLPPGAMVTVQESRQILQAMMPVYFAYTRLNDVVSGSRDAAGWARRILSGARPLGEAVFDLSREIYTHFAYRSGATDISTPLAEVWKRREGVCQDFAHIALSVLRSAGLICRYVCGYIETDPPKTSKRLIGAVATHAWVEVLVPGMVWVAIDPTNDQWVGERHVAVAVGRDYRDAAPVRGTFKGNGGQTMHVSVKMRRLTRDD